MLSCGSRDVFTGFLARSVQELWLIKCLPATIVAGAGVRGSNFYCPLLDSKSPLICIVVKQQTSQAAITELRLFRKSTGVVLRDALPASQRLCANGPLEDCQVRMFAKQRALPSANVCEAGLIAKCECLWSSRTGGSSSYLLLKIKQFCNSQNRRLCMTFQLTLIFCPHHTGMHSEILCTNGSFEICQERMFV